MVNGSRFSAFQHDGKGCSSFCGDKILVQSGYRKERRDRQTVLVNASVREDQDVCAVVIGFVRFDIQAPDRFGELCVFIIQNRDHGGFEAGDIHLFELEHSGRGEDRVDDLDDLAVFGLLF